MASTEHPRQIALGAVLNFRDIGGYLTSGGGHTRWGTVFRSDSLHKLTASEADLFAAVGIRSVYDLRSAEEREGSPSVAGSRHVPVTSRFADLADAARLRSREEAEQWLRDDYHAMLARAGGDFGLLFSLLAEEADRPAVFHCAGGKDRTGLAAALLLSLLGVDRETVLDDFELTSHFAGAEVLGHVVESFCSAGISPEAAEGLLSTPRWAMAEALGELDSSYGGAETYLRDSGGLDARTIASLRSQLVVPPSLS